MTVIVNRGRLIDGGDAHTVARVAAQCVARVLHEAIAVRGSATLALSGGSTPKEAYSLLARETVDWTRTRIFWVDERAVPATDARSNYRLAKESLLGSAPIRHDFVFPMPAEGSDLSAAAADYEATIRAHVTPGDDGVPSLDVAVMGLGEDGHTASLFPFQSTLAIRDRLVAAVPKSEGREARLTLTSPLIEQARHLIFLVVGSTKRDALRRALADDGDVRQTPARLARQSVGEVTWLVDHDAVSPTTA